MSYAEPAFLLYVALCVCLFRVCRPRFRSAFLLAASYAFYFTWSPRAAGLLAFLTLLSYAAALLVERTRSSGNAAPWIGPGVAIFLAGSLLAFKVALLTPARGIGGLVMPVGISYYIFKLISYVLDVHWRKQLAQRDLLTFAAYVSFFPQIIAGPIQRPGEFFAQLPAKPAPVGAALSRIALGLVKKLLIADNLAPAVDFIFSNVHTLHGAPLLAGLYLFPLQLYADFSGLTDIAIGTGRLFGITGPENFNRPFSARSISEYWRCWHMSLTKWLTDYVFMPLRMATRNAGDFGLALSISVNMIAIGLWHGLTMGYLVFGLLNAAYLVVDALTTSRRKKFFKARPQWDGVGNRLGWLLTFHLAAASLVFFRAKEAGDAVWLLSRLWTGWPASLAVLGTALEAPEMRRLAIAAAAYLLWEIGERFRPDVPVARLFQAQARWVRWSVYSAAAALVFVGIGLMLTHSGEGNSPFMYAIF